jgi:hypothetical protein
MRKKSEHRPFEWQRRDSVGCQCGEDVEQMLETYCALDVRLGEIDLGRVRDIFRDQSFRQAPDAAAKEARSPPCSSAAAMTRVHSESCARIDGTLPAGSQSRRTMASSASMWFI